MSAVRVIYQVICQHCGELGVEEGGSGGKTQAEHWFREQGWLIGKHATCSFCVREKKK